MNKEATTILVSMLPSYMEKQIKIPRVQREANVWTLEQQQLLIDSLYNNFDIPKIYCRRDEKEPLNTWWLIDGQQRVTAICMFLKGRFPVGEGSALPSRIHGKMWGALKPADQAKIGGRPLDFIVLDCTEEEEEDLFLRLNNGTPLSAAERRNAIKGKLRDAVSGLAKHPFFKSHVNFSGKRFAFDAVCAQLVHLTISGKPTDAKGPSLTSMYETYRSSFSDEQRVVTEVKSGLQKLRQLFPNKEPYMKKFTVISYFLFMHLMKKRYAMSQVSNGELKAFFESFERARAENSERSPDNVDYDRQIGEYQTACIDGPDKGDSIETRHKILISRFLSAFPKMEALELDGERLFPEDMKTVIYLRSGKKCAGVQGIECPQLGGEISFDEAEFDHVVEHNDGGRTSVENGRLLCQPCHKEKTRIYNKRQR